MARIGKRRSENARARVRASLQQTAQALARRGHKTEIRVARNRDGTIDGEIRIKVPRRRSATKLKLDIAESFKAPPGTYFAYATRFKTSKRKGKESAVERQVRLDYTPRFIDPHLSTSTHWTRAIKYRKDATGKRRVFRRESAVIEPVASAIRTIRTGNSDRLRGQRFVLEEFLIRVHWGSDRPLRDSKRRGRASASRRKGKAKA